jgi:diamine N-acetyltransferase
VTPHTASSVTPSPVVELRQVGYSNLREVLRLRVSEQQTQFVEGVPGSLAEAEVTPDARPWYRAVYAAGDLVGFVMISDGIPPGNPELIGPYYLWRLLIDVKHQGRGYGTRALDLVCDYVRTRPTGDVLMTSAVQGEGGPTPFYLRYGFELTGDVVDDEPVFRLQLC